MKRWHTDMATSFPTYIKRILWLVNRHIGRYYLIPKIMPEFIMLKKTVHLGIFFPLKKSRTIGNTIHGYQLCGQKQEVQAGLYGHIFDEQVNRESFSNKETVLEHRGRFCVLPVKRCFRPVFLQNQLDSQRKTTFERVSASRITEIFIQKEHREPSPVFQIGDGDA